MKRIAALYRSLPRHDTDRPSAVTIGNFDGVHRGHQAILDRLVRHASDRGLSPTVVTFTPHPRTFFALRGQRPELIPTQISSLRDKVSALIDRGVEQVVILRFDEHLADMSAESFVDDLLLRGLRTRWLLVGEDFRFGRKRSGDIALLREKGQQSGFDVHTIADVMDGKNHRVSSSEVRSALALGDLERARHLLGHDYRISGHVIHGQKLGRSIGFPTLNVGVPPLCAARSGVYVVQVRGLDARPLPGVASLGVRPTISAGGRLLLEVHLLGGAVDAYGKLVCVEFLKFLRDEEKFPDLPTMIAAIRQDARGARDHFAFHGL